MKAEAGIAVDQPLKARTNTKQNTRDKILAAARALFVEKGFHDTRPQDISRLAGVGHGTFYLHFADKKACFLAFVDEACAALDAEVERRLEGVHDWPTVVDGLLSGIFDFADTNPGVLLTALTDPGIITAGSDDYKTLINRWGDQWADLITAHMEDGSIYGDYDPEIIGHGIIGLIQQASMNVYRKGGEGREKLIPNLKRFLIRAMAPKGESGPGAL